MGETCLLLHPHPGPPPQRRRKHLPETVEHCGKVTRDINRDRTTISAPDVTDRAVAKGALSPTRRPNRVQFVDELHESLSRSGVNDGRFLELAVRGAMDNCTRNCPRGPATKHVRYQIGATVNAIAAQLGRSVHSVYRSLRRIHQWLFDCIRHNETRQSRNCEPREQRFLGAC